MPRLPTTEGPSQRADAKPGPQRAVAGDEYDPVLGVYTLFVLVPRSEVVYFRLVVESWEDFAVVRTVQRFYEGDRLPPARGVPTRSVVVVLAVPDYIEPCARGLARLCAEVDGIQVPSTTQLREALRRDLLDADATGSRGD